MSQNAVSGGAAAPPAAPVEPSAAERLFSSAGAFWRHLNGLEPGEVAVNLGLSVAVVMMTAFAVWVLRRLICEGLDHYFAKRRHGEPGKPQVAKATWPLVRLLAFVLGFLVVVSIWGLDVIGWLARSDAGQAALRIAGVLLIAVALIEAARHVVDRLLFALVLRRSPGRREAQVKTLGPLLRGCVQGFVVILASLTVLSELGVKIGPLLASAGVVGIAVGFGAQTLVKDFLTGMFLVIEDIVAIGDNVRIGDRSGTVEAMTLRTIRVRNMDGTLHILPYGEAQVISNRTQNFSSYIFELSVGYSAKFDHVFEVMRRTGEQLQADPEMASKITQPLEILGVDQLGESAVVIKARFVTAPGEQWNVGRAYNRLIKEAFDAEGIEMPVPYRKVVFDAPQPATAPPAPFQPKLSPGDDSVNEPE